MSKSNDSTGFLSEAIASWSNLLRFVVLCLLAIAIITAAVVYCFGRLDSADELRISTGNSIEFSVTKGGTIQERVALLSVPASQFWVNTGLLLDPGQEVRIRATGHVNLAFHRLVDAAKSDSLPPADWVGPGGDPSRLPRDVDFTRQRLLLESKDGADYGSLLGYVRPLDEKAPGIDNPRPEPIHVIGESGTVTNLSSIQGELWLVVNDTHLSENDKDAYIGNPPDEEERKLREQRWQYISDKNYWTVWWDDNVGQYLVLIEVVRSGEGT